MAGLYLVQKQPTKSIVALRLINTPSDTTDVTTGNTADEGSLYGDNSIDADCGNDDYCEECIAFTKCDKS